jgi:23S rRNA (pseudouridine1915-N3)-methyltransferase
MKLLCFGKLDNKYDELILEFSKQIPFLEIIELKDTNNLEKEATMLLTKISKQDYLITLEIEGKQLSTFEFSELIDRIRTRNIVFVIGSSFGLSSTIKDRSNYKLSLSKNTFPHAIARLMLVEQIYRHFMIKKNHPYIK